jgi:hypothetical protein
MQQSKSSAKFRKIDLELCDVKDDLLEVDLSNDVCENEIATRAFSILTISLDRRIELGN